jgi:alkylhydroperoxidase family enzyme
MTRLAPLPREQWGDDVREALAAGFSPEVAGRFLAAGPGAIPVPNVLATLMHHPGLAGPFLAYNRVLLHRPVLDPRVRELAVLRVAWRTRSPYEWAQHVRIARGLGVTDDEIDAVVAGPDAGRWRPLERDVLTATDECVDHHRVGDDTWRRLAGELDDRQLVELVFVIGTYTCLAMAFNSFGLQLDEELQGIASPFESAE